MTETLFPTDGKVYVDFTQVDAVGELKFDQNLGIPYVTSKGPAKYVVAGVGGFVAGDYVAITQSASTGLLTATKEDTTTSGATPRKGAVALSTATVGQGAWVLTGPFENVEVNVANGVAAGAALTTTATAGQLGAGGDTVTGLFTLEASGASGLTQCSADYGLGTNN